MLRRSIYLKESQVTILNNLDEMKLSEHVRRAVDQYIDKIQYERVSASASERKNEPNYTTGQ